MLLPNYATSEQAVNSPEGSTFNGRIEGVSERDKESGKEREALGEGITETSGDVTEKSVRGCLGFVGVYKC